MAPIPSHRPSVSKLENAVERHLENPFLVLELSVSSDALACERQGEKLLSMLAAGLAQARTYPTPLGPRPRTAELVRAAMAELREPERRLASPRKPGSQEAMRWPFG